MNTYTKEALKSGVVSGIAFVIVTVGLKFIEGEVIELWKLSLEFLFFTVLMSIYFYNWSKKKADKVSKQ